MTNKQHNFCALLTPNGRGAVAVVWLSGPDSEALIDERFRPAAQKKYSSINRNIVYGVWEPSGEDLIVCRRSDTKFEIHCHGGSLASSQVLDSLTSSNVKLATSETIASLANCNAWEAGVRDAISQASTNRTAELLLRQLTTLPAAIESLTKTIQGGVSTAGENAIETLDEMLSWAELGAHLTHPQAIVFCGQPNVGKSSLLNAIIGFQRAIVHDKPGTTRDVVSQLTAIDGWPVEIKDTAGLRESKEEIESLGIEKAKQQISLGNVVVAVFDLSQPWTNEDETFTTTFEPDLLVFNKSDLAGSTFTEATNRPEGIHVSAINGSNIQTMTEAIGKKLVPELPSPDTAFPTTGRQTERLTEVRQCLVDNDPIKAVQLLRASF